MTTTSNVRHVIFGTGAIGLATLDAESNLRHTVDFRAVYKGLTEQWLEVSADGIVPGAGAFTAPQLVR